MPKINEREGAERFRCGELTIYDTNQIEVIQEGRTVSNEQCSGEQKMFEVRGKDGANLKIAYTTWENGERDISAIEVTGPLALRGLERGRLRLEVRLVKSGHFVAKIELA